MDKIKSRRQSIIKLLESAPMIPVSELASLLGVTKETVRKDLAALEKEGLAVWRHGGAALADRAAGPIPYALRKSFHKEGKRQIARAACALIEEGDTLLLEGSTTTMALCQELQERPELLETLTVITNSFYITQLFEELGTAVKRLFFLGGWLTSSQGTTQGQHTCETLGQFRPDKAFLSGAALGKDLELTAYYENDMYFQREVLRHAKYAILLLDQAKYPSTGFYNVSGLEPIDCLVTDADLPARAQELLRKKNVKFVLAK